MNIIQLFVLVGVFSFSIAKNRFMPNLPLGEYRTIFERIYPCESTKNHILKFNGYLSKKTLNITELVGNITFLKPFDNTDVFDMNVASWSLTGGWKPNSLVYITKSACRKAKEVLGKAWFSFTKAFNMPSHCPVPAGTYISSGFDLKELEEHNFPKIYFYGKYKCTVTMKNEANNVLGCGVMELSLIRPWEKPI